MMTNLKRRFTRPTPAFGALLVVIIAGAVTLARIAVAVAMDEGDAPHGRSRPRLRIGIWRNRHVKTIIRYFGNFGACLQDAQRPGSFAGSASSTHTDSAGQWHHQRPDRGLASESAGGLGIRSRWHVH